MSFDVSVAVEADGWREVPEVEQSVERALEQAAGHLERRPLPGAALSVLLCDDAAIRILNRDWRGHDKATNVLSFPAPGPVQSRPVLGDIAIAWETTRVEAADEGKPVAHHLAHLVVHGFLHLAGFDHDSEVDADAMERLETRILADMGIPDPLRGFASVGAPDPMSQHGRDPHSPASESRGDRRAPPTLMERMRALFGLQAGSIREDIEDAIEGSDTSEVFTPQERSMLRNVLDLHEIRIEDIMVPRADILALALTDTLGEVLARFRDAGHSRLPVHGETLDEPKGMVHIRDFIHYITAPAEVGDTQGGTLHIDMEQSLEASGVMRPVLFVPPSMQALELLVRMQNTRTHMALVIDEFGGTDGIVTIEDIVEVIVGDIEDEHDEDDSPRITPDPDGTFTADARASLDAVHAAVGMAAATEEEMDEVETLGGLVTSLAGHVPAAGEIVSGHAGLDFEILASDPRRVQSVRLRPKPSTSPVAGQFGTETALPGTLSEL